METTKEVSVPFSLTPRFLVVAMTVLQLLWLAGIWVTGATARLDKLVLLVVFTLAVATAVWLMPPFEGAAEKLLAQGRKLLVGLTAVVLAVGFFYASNQRLWPFDEEGNLAAAQIVADQGAAALFTNYASRPWLGNQHPPLGPLIYGTAMRFFGDSLITARLVSLLFAVGLGILTFRLGWDLADRETGLIAALLIFTFPLIFRLGTAAMVEVPLTFLSTLVIWLLIRQLHQPVRRRWLWIGLAFSAGFLLKYTMLFVLPVFLGYLLLNHDRAQLFRYGLPVTGAALVLLAAGLVFIPRSEVLQAQWETMVFYAGQVVTQAYGRQLLLETMTNRLPSALGVYNLPLIGFGALGAWRRRRQSDQFLLLWVGLVWLPLMVTLPDHRYFMMSFPALAVLAAAALKNMYKGRVQVLLLAWLFLAGSLYLFVDWSRASTVFIKW